MKILLFDAGSYTYNDIKEELVKQGYIISELYYHFIDRYDDDFFSERILNELKRNDYDVVFSVNFFPLLAEACNDRSVPYISWSYDSPLDARLTDYFCYDTNHIWLFDRAEVEAYRRAGFGNVNHLPLAINIDRLDRISVSNESLSKFRSDISFVGRLYHSVLDTLLYPADDYVKGYVEALFQTQFRVYGCNFVEKAITNAVVATLNDNYLRLGQDTVKLNKRGLAYAINSQITHIERSLLIDELAQTHLVKVYTDDDCDFSDRVRVYGPVRYFDEMNLVFKGSYLNLCPTLKSIESGIPLRALDIMGAGGVLFSNFQLELSEFFEDGVDVIMYESLEDAIEKAQYYLKNKSILSKIADNGKKKTCKYFSYNDRIRILFSNL